MLYGLEREKGDIRERIKENEERERERRTQKCIDISVEWHFGQLMSKPEIRGSQLPVINSLWVIY